MSHPVVFYPEPIFHRCYTDSVSLHGSFNLRCVFTFFTDTFVKYKDMLYKVFNIFTVNYIFYYKSAISNFCTVKIKLTKF